MLSSFRVTCPHTGCGWTGSLLPSLAQGGVDAEIPSAQVAWFHCPGCGGDWKVRITNDRITALPPDSPRSGPEGEAGAR